LDASNSQKRGAQHGLYEIDSLKLGSLAPEFSGVSVQGQPISLSNLRGKIVLLEFTGTWCGPCQGELPFLKEAYSKFASERMTFVAFSEDDSASTVERYVADKQIPWPTILAPEYNDNIAVRRYNVNGIPRIFLIDTEGRIRAKNLRRADISNAIGELVSK
jgi:peroxiredoxin